MPLDESASRSASAPSAVKRPASASAPYGMVWGEKDAIAPTKAIEIIVRVLLVVREDRQAGGGGK